jgi:nucleotide-binding universal stress UspA family protein
MKAIIATTDFSKASDTAVHYAAQLACSLDVKLILLHATHIPVVSDSYFDMGFTLEELEKSDKESMSALNETLRKKYGAQLKLEKNVKIGFASELIRDTIRKEGAGLVVMGISHMDKFSQVVFGSTSTSIAGHLSTPVLIIPDKVKFKPWKKIAFTFDQKNLPTGTGVRELNEIRQVFDAQMHFVNVMDSPFIGKDETVLKPLQKIFRGVTCKTHFLDNVKGKTVEVINDWVRRHKASAVVMVARQHGLMWRLLNERTTKKMAFSTKVPLFVMAEKKV